MFRKTPVGEINIPEPIIVPIIIPTPLNNVILRLRTTFPSPACDSSPITQKINSPVNRSTCLGWYDVRVTTAAGGRQDRPPRTLLHDWLTFCYHFYDLRDWNRLCLCRQRERTEHASRAFGRCRACENSRNTVPGARDPAAATKPYQLEIRATGAAKFTLNLLISYPTKCDSTRGSTKQTHC